MNDNEKKLLNKLAKENGVTIADYIRYKIFYNNAEISDEDYVYESPAKDKHNYLTIGVLHDLYWMMYNFVAEHKNKEEMEEFREHFHKNAKKSIINYGYLKVEQDE